MHPTHTCDKQQPAAGTYTQDGQVTRNLAVHQQLAHNANWKPVDVILSILCDSG